MANRYDSTRQWYAIHTYSGYEEKVADSIRQRLNAVDMADKIFDVMVPKEKQIEIKNGKRKVVEKKTLSVTLLALLALSEPAPNQLQYLIAKSAKSRSVWVSKNQNTTSTSKKAKWSVLLTAHSRASTVQSAKSIHKKVKSKSWSVCLAVTHQSNLTPYRSVKFNHRNGWYSDRIVRA
jgi:plasmid maintenance system killer protein